MNKEFLEKIRVFVLDHIKVVLPVLLLVVTAVVTYVSLSARDRRLDMIGTVANEDPELVQTTGLTEEDQSEAVLALTENTDQALSDFFTGYYQCLSSGDMDTLETMVDSIETMDKLVKAEQSRFLDYEITDIYTLPGYDSSSLIAFVVSGVRFDAYPEDLLPAYDGYYLKKDENGAFKIINSEPSVEESDYIAYVLACDDVVELGNRITTEYNDLITENTKLLPYMKELDSVVTMEAGEKLAALTAGQQIEMPEIETPDEEEQEVRIATANSSVNVRISDSMNADTMGQISAGQSVEVTEIKGNGWSQINYDGKSGYVKSEYLTMEIDIDSVVTIGTVTATETLNIRANASTDGMVMGSFARGTTARLVEEKDGWCEVVYNNKVVYLSSQYLEIELD